MCVSKTLTATAVPLLIISQQQKQIPQRPPTHTHLATHPRSSGVLILSQEELS